MAFSKFQNDTATLRQMQTDFAGNMSANEAITIRCDVQYEVKRMTNREGEQVTTVATVFATPTPELDALQLNDKWIFEYSDETYNVERFQRVRYPASSAISHYQIYLR
jgi:hypothetical protein